MVSNGVSGETGETTNGVVAIPLCNAGVTALGGFRGGEKDWT
jgi:hypothetical protein